MKLGHDTLKARQRELRLNLPKAVNLRVHRALSWLQAANQVNEEDARFIFLWIAFNAIYGQESGADGDFGDRKAFRGFLTRLVEVDSDMLIHGIAWESFSDKVRLFIDYRNVHDAFWLASNEGLARQSERRAANHRGP